MKAPRSPGTACRAVARKKCTCRPGQPAGLQAALARGLGEPALPACRYLVVADVGRVAEVDGPAAGRGDPGRPVVAQDHRRPRAEAGRGQVGPGDEGGERVGLDADEPGPRPPAARREQEPGRAGARVHHLARPGVAGLPGRPPDHARHDRRRGERLAQPPAFGRGPGRAERVTQRVAAGGDPGADRVEREPRAGAGCRCRGGQLSFGRGQARDPLRAQLQRRPDQRGQVPGPIHGGASSWRSPGARSRLGASPWFRRSPRSRLRSWSRRVSRSR